MIGPRAENLATRAETHSGSVYTADCALVKKNDDITPKVTNKSERNQIDSEAAMGTGATRSLERVAAAMGQLESAPIEFEATCDVTHGNAL
jgi:hypothetical protein